MKASNMTSPTWAKLWAFKHNQLPRIGEWLNRHSQTAVMATCLVAGGFAICQIAAESELQSRADSIHATAYDDGLKTGLATRKEELAKQVTLEACMAFYFNNDTTRVGKALKTGRMQ